MLKDNLD